jgi:hypothetical protein
MVTHIDADWKFRKLKGQMQHAAAGICMSADSMHSLAAAGIPANKLCYINPAHDAAIRPRPLLVGLTTRVYPDGRKREGLLLKLAERIDPGAFSFMIMGDGWDNIVDVLRSKGFRIDYRPYFNLEEYQSQIPGLDYYLYLGMDEGSMGFIDALAAGVPTIVTSQGFHLDAAGGLVHPFETAEELCAVFERITGDRSVLVNSVARWTWRDYAMKHRELWEFLLSGTQPTASSYEDGLMSLGKSEGVSPRFADQAAARCTYIRGSLRGMRSIFTSSRKKTD